MEIKITYSKLELDRAIDYCWTHNPSWQLDDKTRDDIRKDFISNMHRLAINRNFVWVGAARGCILIPDMTEEGMDSDENHCHISIYVPTGFCYDVQDIEADVGVEMASVPAAEYWKTEVYE